MQHSIKVGELEYRAWRYRYILAFALSVLGAAIILVDSAVLALLYAATGWSYLGAFVIGAFYTFSITSPLAAAAFFVATKNLNPFVAAALGGTGALLFDLLILRFFNSKLLPEARLLARDFGVPRIKFGHWLRYVKKVAPFLVGVVIASPLPDELGVAMMGSLHYDMRTFVMISWCGNTLGLLAITLLSHAL